MRHGLPAAILLCALVVPLTSVFPVRADSGLHSICFREGDPDTSAPQGNRYFRRSFSVGRWADEAVLDITADNAFTVWINGHKIGSGDNWKKVYRFDVRAQIVDGRNVIAVEARNGKA